MNGQTFSDITIIFRHGKLISDNVAEEAMEEPGQRQSSNSAKIMMDGVSSSLLLKQKKDNGGHTKHCCHCYWTKLGIVCPTCSKANLLTPGCGDKVQHLIQGIKQKENGTLMLKQLNSPVLSREGVLKQGEGCGLQVAWSVHEQVFSWVMVR